MSEPSIVSAIPPPLATAAQFTRRFAELCKAGPASDTLSLEELMVEASSFIEDSTDRRLAPFTGLTYSVTLRGIDPSGYGLDSGSPLDIYGSLGLSQANAYGTSDFVRDFWLDQTAPHYPDMWSVEISSISIALAVGSTITVDPARCQGPTKDTGHVRMPLGTLAPEGSELTVVYSGGYNPIPPSLSRLCLYQVAKFVMLDMEPEDREAHNYSEIDRQCLMLMANWARG